MLEKDIENLIAQYPDEFFPGGGFKLNGQQVRLGNCRADIAFIDKYERTILIEVKRGILTRDASGQIMEYYGLIKQENPNTIVELILCANVIPHERKIFLENAGIECKELGLGLIQNIANKYNYIFLDEKESIKPVEKNIKQFLHNEHNKVWIFQANPDRYDILNALTDPNIDLYCWQVNQFKNEIKKGDEVFLWMSGHEGGIYAIATVLSNPEIRMDFPAEEKYWVKEDDRYKSTLKVVLKTESNLINSPLFRHDLKAIKELNNLKILKFSQGTNFPVSYNERNVIRSLIMGKNA